MDNLKQKNPQKINFLETIVVLFNLPIKRRNLIDAEVPLKGVRGKVRLPLPIIGRLVSCRSGRHRQQEAEIFRGLERMGRVSGHEDEHTRFEGDRLTIEG